MSNNMFTNTREENYFLLPYKLKNWGDTFGYSSFCSRLDNFLNVIVISFVGIIDKKNPTEQEYFVISKIVSKVGDLSRG